MLARARQTINYRDLLYNLVVRDLKVRYKHSFLGFFWSLLNPLLLMGVFTFVFSTLLENHAKPAFPIFFLCALLPWNWCAASVTGTLGSIVNSGYLIKKVYFPREMLPLAVVLSNMVNFVLSMPALLIFMVFLKPDFTIHMLWWPTLVLIQALFLTGLGFFLSALNVFFRDTSVLVEVGLSAWFFLTPIIYDATEVAGQYANWMYYLNPMASIVATYRTIFYYGSTLGPDPIFMLRTFITSAIIFVLGYLFFARMSKRFGEEI